MTFAEQRFDRLGREMAMARADVDDERIWRARGARQRLPESGINRLPNHVFDDSSMWCSCSNDHNATSFDRFSYSVNIYLAKSFNIYQSVA